MGAAHMLLLCRQHRARLERGWLELVELGYVGGGEVEPKYPDVFGSIGLTAFLSDLDTTTRRKHANQHGEGGRMGGGTRSSSVNVDHATPRTAQHNGPRTTTGHATQRAAQCGPCAIRHCGNGGGFFLGGGWD